MPCDKTAKEIQEALVHSDWPEHLPILDEELELLEEHLIEILQAMIQHG
ncbi:MAG: hypothetical protein ACPGOV_14810 [Magnetovibrionaceae bacterium]